MACLRYCVLIATSRKISLSELRHVKYTEAWIDLMPASSCYGGVMPVELLLQVVQFLLGPLGYSEDSSCKEHGGKNGRNEQPHSYCDACLNTGHCGQSLSYVSDP